MKYASSAHNEAISADKASNGHEAEGIGKDETGGFTRVNIVSYTHVRPQADPLDKRFWFTLDSIVKSMS